MSVIVFSASGRKSGTLTLPKNIFSAKVNDQLMAQAVRVHLHNQRQGTKKAKRRGEVQGSGKKIYRQKGTGRARHGDRQAPIFVGGGATHGPTGKENYSRKLTKSMRRQALLSALTTKASAKQIAVVNQLETLEPKTKKIHTTLNHILTHLKLTPDSKISLILPSKIDQVSRAARNLPNVFLFQASQLNTYQALNGGTLLFMKPSIDLLKKTLTQKTSTK